MNDCCNRRGFLTMSLGLTAGAALASRLGLSALGQDTPTAALAKAKRCIVLWMMGAPSQMDTWDPKPGTETGGPFKDIETAADGIRIAEHMPRIARQMDKVSLIRTVTSRDPNHDTAQYLLHTGWRRAADVEHPALGAVITQELGLQVADLPGGVVLGSTPPSGAGYLDAASGPIVFDRLASPAEDVLANASNPRDRFEQRWKLLKRAEERFAAGHEDARVEQRRRAYEKAYQVLTSERVKAFDVRKEPEESRRAYGDSDYGRALLMSRRLVEAGVRFVEVMYGDWDTHRDNFGQVKTLLDQTDGPIAALLEDLARRGLLQETLVLWMGEFGRTPRINGSNGRDHWTTWSVAMAGGGIQGGRVVGRTDPLGMSIAERPVPVGDLFATIYSCFGIDPGKQLVTVPRPMKVVEAGTPVKELF